MLLPKGEFTIIDTDRFEWFIQHKWYVAKTNRNQMPYTHGSVNGKVVSYHRYITSCPPGLVVDHRNNYTRDNRRSNLRIATTAQNNCNLRRLKAGSSSFKGVHLEKKSGRWKAVIKPPSYPRGKRLFLGTFVDELDAARAYNAAAREHFGEYAYLNRVTSSTAV
ncbi:HNH endonuclease [Tundrisphaera sp. TA3]|uniref:HNH endonuclease n=1 Tax=Tundrisphaera sp. TA3 TaxID=3435775 RepID=UPI003EBA183A